MLTTSPRRNPSSGHNGGRDAMHTCTSVGHETRNPQGARAGNGGPLARGTWYVVPPQLNGGRKGAQTVDAVYKLQAVAHKL